MGRGKSREWGVIGGLPGPKEISPEYSKTPARFSAEPFMMVVLMLR